MAQLLGVNQICMYHEKWIWILVDNHQTSDGLLDEGHHGGHQGGDGVVHCSYRHKKGLIWKIYFVSLIPELKHLLHTSLNIT